MKRIIVALAFLVLAASSVQAESYTTIAGITLGDDVSRYEDILRMGTATDLKDSLYMREVKLRQGGVSGIRGGSVCYAVCNEKGRVARLKLKFEDRSPDLFEKLLKLYTKKFGSPGEWLGNAFHTVLAWKWELKSGDNVVEVVLMYSQLDDLRPGVSIKATLNNLWESERECWYKTQAGTVEAEERKLSGKLLPLEDYVPH